MRPVEPRDFFDVDPEKIVIRNGNEHFGALPRSSGRSFVPVDPSFRLSSLYCRFFSCSTLSQPFWIRRRDQRFMTIEYIYSGEITVETGARKFVAQTGDLVLLHAGRDNSLVYPGGVPCVKCGFIFTGALLGAVTGALNLNGVNLISIGDPGSLERRFQALRAAVEASASPETENAETLAELSGRTLELLQYIAIPPRPHPIPEQALAIRDYLRAHSKEKISIPEICAHFGMSQPMLNKHFAAGFQTTPWQYLLKLRLGEAAAALQRSNAPLKIIADLAGYGSTEHFAAEFKRLHGLSPGRYRQFSRDGGMPVAKHTNKIAY